MKQTYTDKVFEKLINMDQGEVFVINNADNVDPANRDKFIDCVKTFIQLGYDHLYGFVIELNGSVKENIPHTKVRKNGIWRKEYAKACA